MWQLILVTSGRSDELVLVIVELKHTRVHIIIFKPLKEEPESEIRKKKGKKFL